MRLLLMDIKEIGKRKSKMKETLSSADVLSVPFCLLLEEKVPRRGGCGVAAKSGVRLEYGCYAADTTSVTACAVPASPQGEALIKHRR